MLTLLQKIWGRENIKEKRLKEKREGGIHGCYVWFEISKKKLDYFKIIFFIAH